MKRKVISLLVITAMTISCNFVGCGDTQEAMGSAEGTETVTDAASNEEVPAEVAPTPASYETIILDAKQQKEQTRTRNKEILLEIINSEGLTDAQRQEAVDAMVMMTAIAEKEEAAEILLEAKGYENVVVSINGDAVDVVVNAVELTDEQRAQIEDIVARKTEISVENIIITAVGQNFR